MKFHLPVATLATLLSVVSLQAQQEQPGPIEANEPPASQISQVDNTLSKEQILAKCLALTNQEEVSLAKFAKEKISNAEVKALAAMLEKSHQQSLDELKGLASKTAVTKKPVNSNSPVATSNAAAVDFLQMHQEMSEQCLKDSKETLSKKEGAEFDACFVGMQIAKHAMMHSSLTVLQRHTTGELQGLIKSGLAKNDEHLQAATSLMERLSDKAEVRTAKNAK